MSWLPDRRNNSHSMIYWPPRNDNYIIQYHRGDQGWSYGYTGYHTRGPTDAPSSRTLAFHLNDAKYQVRVNVKHFKPENITVKTVGKFLVVHGKHNEQADDHGYVAREFTRRYELPPDIHPEELRCTLTRDGILTVKVPVIDRSPLQNERIIPMTPERMDFLMPSPDTPGGDAN